MLLLRNFVTKPNPVGGTVSYPIIAGTFFGITVWLQPACGSILLIKAETVTHIMFSAVCSCSFRRPRFSPNNKSPDRDSHTSVSDRTTSTISRQNKIITKIP
jgi:hypothetical protein